MGREPLRNTLRRTLSIAAAVGFVVAVTHGGLGRWPLASLLALWFSLGGHFVEIGFLSFVRPHLPATRLVQVAARAATWFLGGAVLWCAMALTAHLLAGGWLRHWPAWYLGGLAFIGVELLAHASLELRRQPSFYNGRG